jgi:prepilin-type N-terminal cleavage/methylation domain-containing protein
MPTRGYTLIETVIVIVIVAVLAAFIAPVLSNAVTSYDTTTRNVEVLTRMRYAMERMDREIRDMRRDPVDSAQYDIVVGSMTATMLEFCKADGTRVTVDGAAVAGEVRLGYTAGFASTCTASAATTQTLTDAVTAFTFIYCQIDGTSCTPGFTVDQTNVAFVDITMTLTGTGTGAYTSTARVDLRSP